MHGQLEPAATEAPALPAVRGALPAAVSWGVLALSGALVLGAVVAGSSLLLVVGALLFSFCCALLLPVDAAFLIAMYWLTAQNVALPALYSSGSFSPESMRLIIIVKELTYSLLLARLLLRVGRPKFTKQDWYLIGFSAFCVLHMAIPGVVPIWLRGMALRSLLIIPLFYFCGRLYVLDDPTGERLQRFARHTVILGVATAVFGLVTYYVFGLGFWQAIEVGKFVHDVKGIPEAWLNHGVPGDFVRDFDETRPRLSSFPGEPLSTGYYLYFTAVIAFARLHGRRTLWQGVALALIIWALAMTQTRAALLALLVSIYFYFRRSLKRPWLAPVVVGVVMLALLAVPQVHVITQATIQMSDTSSAGHWWMVILGVETVLGSGPFRLLFGAGVGYAGAFTAMNEDSFGGFENVYLVMLVQVGLIGLSLFIASMWASFKLQVKGDLDFEAVKSTIVGFLLTGMFSEQLCTATSAGPFWMGLGVIASVAALRQIERARPTEADDSGQPVESAQDGTPDAEAAPLQRGGPSSPADR